MQHLFLKYHDLQIAVLQHVVWQPLDPILWRKNAPLAHTLLV